MANLLASSSIAGLVLAATTATAAMAQDYDDYEHEYGNEQNSLTLICWGEGRRPSTNESTRYVWDSRRDRFVPQTYVNDTTQEFNSEVQVELHDNWGRIDITGALVPAIHSGGNNGWWELENVHVGQDTITARYRLNGLNSPRVEIDRRSGRIKINGIEDFRGECDQGQWSDRRNRF